MRGVKSGMKNLASLYGVVIDRGVSAKLLITESYIRCMFVFVYHYKCSIFCM